MGFSLSGLLKKVPVVGGIAGGVVGGIGGALNTRAANKAAQVDAENQTASNRWRHKLDTATYANERLPGLKKGARTRSFRNQIAAAIAKNPKYGLQNLLPGYFNLQKEYAPAYEVVNPYEAAGEPPAVKAAKASMLGGILSGAAGGAVQGAQAGQYFSQKP